MPHANAQIQKLNERAARILVATLTAPNAARRRELIERQKFVQNQIRIATAIWEKKAQAV